ncbi:GPI inositol deacylase, partial [Coemansia spiralis]
MSGAETATAPGRQARAAGSSSSVSSATASCISRPAAHTPPTPAPDSQFHAPGSGGGSGPWPAPDAAGCSRSSSWRAYGGTLLVLLVSIAFGALAARSYFTNQVDVPSCAMSYSRPQYLEQTEFGRDWTRYSAKYRLYLYREGGFDQHIEPSRVPVLFVPGNAGSHKQVRSIAAATSSALVDLVGKDTAAAAERGQIGYDFFTLGLNEELT